MIECAFENGIKINLRHVTVTVLALDKNQILLVKRTPKISEGEKYALPGGFLERDETPDQGALRELREETGYQASSLTLFRINSSPNRKGEDRQNVDFIFLAQSLTKVSQHDQEETEIKWFNLDSVPDKGKMAFDHLKNIELLKEYLKGKIKIPLV